LEFGISLNLNLYFLQLLEQLFQQQELVSVATASAVAGAAVSVASVSLSEPLSESPSTGSLLKIKFYRLI
jgi:hypothetical protein